jgi:hypothetical protein
LANCVLAGNTIGNPGQGASGGQAGFGCESGCTVQNNFCRGSSGYGYVSGCQGRYPDLWNNCSELADCNLHYYGGNCGRIIYGLPQMTRLRSLSNGVFQFNFTNLQSFSPGAVLATTNPAAPIAQWINLGPPTLIVSSNRLYQFNDPAATNNRPRFYRLRWP